MVSGVYHLVNFFGGITMVVAYDSGRNEPRAPSVLSGGKPNQERCFAARCRCGACLPIHLRCGIASGTIVFTIDASSAS